MSRLRMLQVSMATMIVSTGLAFVSSMVGQRYPDLYGKGQRCHVRSEAHRSGNRTRRLRSCLRAERR